MSEGEALPGDALPSGCPLSRDGFAAAREEEGLHIQRDGEEEVPLILRHRDVRAAAKDWRSYSSNAPFRVPIPSEEKVRRIRQIPIEYDPPEHTAYRKLIEPWFLRPRQAEYRARLGELVDAALAEACAAGEVEVAGGLALRLQSRALAVLLGVPQSHSELWISWGHALYRDRDGNIDGAGKDRELEDYLKGEFAAARSDPSREDFFALLTRAQIDGRALCEDELLGIANLVFAGGRDTVITMIAEIIAHFAAHPEERQRIAANSRLVPGAVEEFVRAVSPLAMIGRLCPQGADVEGVSVAAGSRIGLCWASANYDAAMFDAPGEIRLDRKRNPHMGFGSGPHACLGSVHARALLGVLIERLVEPNLAMEVRDAVPGSERFNGLERRLGYERLVVRFRRSNAG